MQRLHVDAHAPAVRHDADARIGDDGVARVEKVCREIGIGEAGVGIIDGAHRPRTRLEQVLAYIDLHYADNLTLESMCSVSDVSPQHLCRLFRRKLNIRPMEYIAKKRIQEAKALLLNSPRNIAEISRIVGYNNCNYFCITFKKYEGVSPTEYRKTMG